MAKEENVFISEDDAYLFGKGTHYDIYKKLGAHITTKGGWAPNAKEVYVIGSFNGWQENQYPMERMGEIGIYTTFIKNVKKGDMYKFLILTEDGHKLYKADPYANAAELRPGTASVVADLDSYAWKDKEWMKSRKKQDVKNAIDSVLK